MSPDAGSRGADLAQRIAAFSRTRKAEWLTAFLVFAAGSVFFTWPLARGLTHSIYGAHGDLTGGIAYYRELVQEGLTPFSPGVITDWAFPFGRPVEWATGLAGFGSGAILWVLTLAFGAVAAYAWFTLAGYALTGLATFGLVRWLGFSRLAALVAGWSFAFYPFALLKGQGHNDFMQGWVIVLLVWSLLWLGRAPSWRRGIVASLVVLGSLTFSGYFILFGAIPVLCIGLWGFVRGWRAIGARMALTAYAALLALPAVTLSGLWIIGRTAGAGGERQQTLAQLATYSARPWEYVLPATETPFVGTRGTQWLMAHLHGSNLSEARLYVGLSILALAGLGIVASVRCLRAGSRWPASAMLALATTAAAAFLVSLPPRVDLLGWSVPMPSAWIFAITPTWRVYSRLVMVVMLCLAVVAAGGIDWIRRRLPYRRLSSALAAGVALVVVVDLWAPWPQPRVTDVGFVPSVYQAVAKQPEAPVAHYPLMPAAETSSYETFYQDATGKPMLNGYLEGSEAERIAAYLPDLASSATVRGLQALGVAYVIRRTAGTPEEGRALAPVAPGMRPFARDEWGIAYTIPPSSTAALAVPTTGFGGPEAGPAGPLVWMTEADGLIRVAAPCPGECVVRVKFTLGSYQRARTAILRTDGVAPRSVRVPAQPGNVTVLSCVRVRARLGGIRIRAIPGPQEVDGPDLRRVSLQVGIVSVGRTPAAPCTGTGVLG